MPNELARLQKSPRTSVFRAVEAILRYDPMFSSVVNGKRLRTWSGDVNDAIQFTLDMAPCVRLTPIPAPEEWASPGLTKGALMIHIEMLVAGFNYDDVFNLYWAIEKAFYPPATNAVDGDGIRAQLLAAGAFSGIVTFSQPTYDPTPKDMYFHAFGQMKVDVRLNLAPPQ